LEIAQANHCAYADVWSAQGCRDYVVHQDTCHANKIGNMLIAHEVFRAIIHAAPGIAHNVRKRDETPDWTQRTASMRAQRVEESNKSLPGR